MFIPDPNFFQPGSRIHIKKYFNPKINTKLSEILSGLFVHPATDFLPIPDSGSRGQKGTGSRIRIRNTGRSTTDLTGPETIFFLLLIKS